MHQNQPGSVTRSGKKQCMEGCVVQPHVQLAQKTTCKAAIHQFRNRSCCTLSCQPLLSKLGKFCAIGTHNNKTQTTPPNTCFNRATKQAITPSGRVVETLISPFPPLNLIFFCSISLQLHTHKKKKEKKEEEENCTQMEQPRLPTFEQGASVDEAEANDRNQVLSKQIGRRIQLGLYHPRFSKVSKRKIQQRPKISSQLLLPHLTHLTHTSHTPHTHTCVSHTPHTHTHLLLSSPPTHMSHTHVSHTLSLSHAHTSHPLDVLLSS